MRVRAVAGNGVACRAHLGPGACRVILRSRDDCVHGVGHWDEQRDWQGGVWQGDWRGKGHRGSRGHASLRQSYRGGRRCLLWRRKFLGGR